MTNGVPLLGVSISDFRRLDGHRFLPLNAPVVLLHGPNGAGKTSVLSALELALTGEVRSMRRQDPRYTAHLPTHGHAFATVRAEVSEGLGHGSPPRNMTVGGDRVEGVPALAAAAAQFYSERCFLDQVSLGQLLELYQYREGKEESALARFVNELLGLDQLDALRSGLSEATDVRRVRKISDGYSEAEAGVERADGELRSATVKLADLKRDLDGARTALIQRLTEVGVSPPDSGWSDLAAIAQATLDERFASAELQGILALEHRLTSLGGRIDALLARPSTVRAEDARARALSAAADLQQWRIENEQEISRLRQEVATIIGDQASGSSASLDDELTMLEARLSRHQAAAAEIAQLEERVADKRARLADVQTEIATLEQQAGALAAALAVLREHVTDDVCPVCDRDFNEVATGHLTDHLEAKISELTNVGRRLQSLKEERASLAAEVDGDLGLIAAQRVHVLSADQLADSLGRQGAGRALRDRMTDLQPVIARGEELEAASRDARIALADLEAVEQEDAAVKSELAAAADSLGEAQPAVQVPVRETWQRLAATAASRSRQLAARSDAMTQLATALAQFRQRTLDAEVTERSVAQAAKAKLTWDERLAEAKRRQGIAREVHAAANTARSAIVQRVFTESLNEVWRSVFTRLAPREPFVPAFGVPTASKTALELSLQTVHSSGQTAGTPQMMLSAGNLNTAALSLFIALHLAVEPVVPCLVFDDPVQSMDEIHVAQFAGLIRVLSKHHGRQVIVAVHERELFDYLALELSPAYAGDALITIELGDRSNDDDGGVTRLEWSPDPAIAV